MRNGRAKLGKGFFSPLMVKVNTASLFLARYINLGCQAALISVSEPWTQHELGKAGKMQA